MVNKHNNIIYILRKKKFNSKSKTTIVLNKYLYFDVKYY